MTATEKAMENFGAQERIDDDTLNGGAGLYRANSTTKKYDEKNEVGITAKEYKDAISGLNLPKRYDRYQDKFWSEFNTDVRLLAKGQALSVAMKQRTNNTLSPEGLATLDKEIFGSMLKNSDISLKNLYAETRHGLGTRVTTFDINGYAASNIFMLYDPKGKVIVHMPSGKQCFKEFDNEQQMKQWFLAQIKDPKSSVMLAGHFSLFNNQDGMFTSGVLTAMKNIQEGSWGIDSINIKPQIITSDPFSWLRDRMRDRAYSDAEILTTSNEEVFKEQIKMNIAAAKPFVGLTILFAPLAGGLMMLGMDLAELALDIDKAVNADTYAQRKQGIKSSFLDGGMILFDGIASYESISELAVGARAQAAAAREISDDVNIFQLPKYMETEGAIESESGAVGGVDAGTDAEFTPVVELEEIKPTFWERYVKMPTQQMVTIAANLNELRIRSPQRFQMLYEALEETPTLIRKVIAGLDTPKGREILSLHLGYLDRSEAFREAVRACTSLSSDDLVLLRRQIRRDPASPHLVIDDSKTPPNIIVPALERLGELGTNEMRSLLHEIKTFEEVDLRQRFAQYLEQLSAGDIDQAKSILQSMLDKAEWVLTDRRSFRYVMFTNKKDRRVTAFWQQDQRRFGITELYFHLTKDGRQQTLFHELSHGDPAELVDYFYPPPRFGEAGAGYIKAKRDQSLLFARGELGIDYLRRGSIYMGAGKLAKTFDPETKSYIMAATRLQTHQYLRKRFFFKNADSFALYTSEAAGTIPGTIFPDGTINTPFRPVKDR